MNSSCTGHGAKPGIPKSPSPVKNKRPMSPVFLKRGSKLRLLRKLCCKAGFNPADEFMAGTLFETAVHANGLFRSVCGQYGYSRRDGEGVWVAFEERFLPTSTRTLPQWKPPQPCSPVIHQGPASPTQVPDDLLGMLSGGFGSPGSPLVSQNPSKRRAGKKSARLSQSGLLLRALANPASPYKNPSKKPRLGSPVKV